VTSKSSRRQQRRLPAPFHPLNPSRAVFAGATILLAFHRWRKRERERHVGARERDDAALPSTLLFPPSMLLLLLLLLFLCLPYPTTTTTTPLAIVLPVPGSRKYRLSYSFEGAENRYGAFCARATGEVPNRRCRRSFSRQLGFALARLATCGPPLVGV